MTVSRRLKFVKQSREQASQDSDQGVDDHPFARTQRDVGFLQLPGDGRRVATRGNAIRERDRPAHCDTLAQDGLGLGEPSMLPAGAPIIETSSRRRETRPSLRFFESSAPTASEAIVAKATKTAAITAMRSHDWSKRPGSCGATVIAPNSSVGDADGASGDDRGR